MSFRTESSVLTFQMSFNINRPTVSYLLQSAFICTHFQKLLESQVSHIICHIEWWFWHFLAYNPFGLGIFYPIQYFHRLLSSRYPCFNLVLKWFPYAEYFQDYLPPGDHLKVKWQVWLAFSLFKSRKKTFSKYLASCSLAKQYLGIAQDVKHFLVSNPLLSLLTKGDILVIGIDSYLEQEEFE